MNSYYCKSNVDSIGFLAGDSILVSINKVFSTDNVYLKTMVSTFNVTQDLHFATKLEQLEAYLLNGSWKIIPELGESVIQSKDLIAPQLFELIKLFAGIHIRPNQIPALAKEAGGNIYAILDLGRDVTFFAMEFHKGILAEIDYGEELQNEN
jgi:hypothetical protein